jgi:hypothetical protein
MDLKELFDKWKTIVAFTIVVVGATTGFIAWAEEQQLLIEAKQQLIHNEMYQEGRISHKELQVDQYRRELKRVLDYIGDREPTLREARDLEWLDEEIARLRQEIEDIRVIIATPDDH